MTETENNQIFASEINEDYIEIIAKFNGDLTQLAMDLSATVEILTCNYAVITLPYGNLDLIYNYSEIEYVELPKNLTYLLFENLHSVGVTSVKSRLNYGLTGEGVIVGIIDSGIDYTHRDFRNVDGSTRIMYLWDQNIPGNPPEGFVNGSVYDESDINEALRSDHPYSIVPSRDSAGHGTAVAGIAAGNGNESGGAETGVASSSPLIIVKLGNYDSEFVTRSTEIMRAAKFIIDKAIQHNMPVSINLSYGTNNGSHDGESIFEQYMDTICDMWKNVTSVAVGNEGVADHHYSAIVRNYSVQIVEFICTNNLNGFYLSLWKSFNDSMTFELVSPSGKSSGIVSYSNRNFVISMDGFNVMVNYTLPTHYSTNQEIYFRFQTGNTEAVNGVWRLYINCGNIVDGLVNIWMSTLEDVLDNAFFLQADVYGTITIASTTRRVISVGGFNSYNNTFAQFSGRGGMGGIKYPNITAPAVNIYTCKAGGGYGTFTGTSMAAPFVCGSAALMMQWGIVRGNDPFLYGQKIKAFLQRSARRTTYISYPDPAWGYGVLDLEQAMDELAFIY